MWGGRRRNRCSNPTPIISETTRTRSGISSSRRWMRKKKARFLPSFHVRVERVILKHHANAPFGRRFSRHISIVKVHAGRRLGFDNPATTRNNVVFPHPDGPRIARVSPERTTRFNSSRARPAGANQVSRRIVTEIASDLRREDLLQADADMAGSLLDGSANDWRRRSARARGTAC